MNVLVTGATGFIGSHLCAELVRREHHVFGLSHSGKPDKVQRLLSRKNFQLKVGSIRDVDMLRSLIKDNKIKVVLHVAAKIPNGDGPDRDFLYFDTNAVGTLSLLTASMGSVDKFVYASTMSVYTEPPEHLPVNEGHPVQPNSIYGVAKLAGELCCQVYAKSMSIMVLRYSGAYGPGQRKSDAIPVFLKQALNNKPITVYGDGRQTSDFVYIKDLVRGTLLALAKNEPGVYNIGGGEEVSVRDIARQIIRLTGSKSETIFTGEAAERPFRFVLDITKAKQTFGYAPGTFAEGLSTYVKEFNIEV